MKEVRAFVGHSFIDGDAEVVRAFLTYLDQVSILHPAFAWQHATVSEPRDLREKVLDLAADKNVFIGICTRKELVATEADFQPSRFERHTFKIRSEKLQWKTSDWVIQEIGLAVGRGMSLILLVEDGVRQPGGLQGNVEYITFKRSAPSQVFGKLLEMIHALSPSAAMVPQTGDALAASPSSENALVEKDGDPKPSWTEADYLNAFFVRTLKGDEAGADAIKKAYLETPHAADDENAGQWEANVEWGKILFGTGGSLAKLQELSRKYPANHKIASWLADALSRFGENEEAARADERAAALATDVSTKVTQLGLAARRWRRAGRQQESAAALYEMKALAADEQREDVLQTLADLAEIADDQELHVEALEGLSECGPDDQSRRFSVAYKHSELGNDDLSLNHYLKVPPQDRTATHWNNLAVALQTFGMPGKAVSAYRTSAEMGGTLAMSNLAYKFMNAGFFAEAQVEFDRALKIENFHKNVGEGVAALRGAPEAETKTQAEIIADVRDKAAFYRSLGRAIVEPNADPTGEWQSPLCVLSVTTSGDTFEARGEYERTNALGFSSAAQPTRHFIHYKGQIVGRRISGSIRRWSDGQQTASSLLGISENTVPFYMIISGEGDKISVMENWKSRRPTLYELKP